LTRRTLSASLVALLSAMGLSVAAEPAQASTLTFITPASWTYTDLHNPRRSFTDDGVAAPVGARFGDDGYHSSRSYFRFEIGQLRGKQILNADFYVHEKSTCTNVAPVELWLTDDVTADTSWLRPPKQRELLGQADIGCGSGVRLAWDVDAHVQEWLDDGRDHVTLGMRIAGGHEFDPKLGRAFGDNFLSVNTNLPPSGLRGVSPCGTPEDTPYLNGDLRLRGTYNDPDMLPENGSQYEDTTFAVWPISDVAQRREFVQNDYADGVAELDWRNPGLAEGEYAWTFKVSDRSATSDWAATCYFTIDKTRPGEPSVSSLDYPADGVPHGGTGLPGSFTFTPTSPDTAQFAWRMNNEAPRYEATQLGQPLTLQLTPHAAPGNVLRVSAIDRAGNYSDEVRYEFKANDTRPEVSFVIGGLSLPSTMTMASRVPAVTEFRYTIDNGPQQRVPVGASASATVDVVFDQSYPVVSVEAWSATQLLGSVTVQPSVDSMPVVAVRYQTGSSEATVTVQPRRLGIVSYLYQLDYAGDYLPVTANPDGSAAFALTGLISGFHHLNVLAYTADGYAGQGQADFDVVNDVRPGPYVSSPDYHPSPVPLGGVGIPGQFDLNGDPDIDHYVVSYEGQPEFVVTCPGDCFEASFTFAPTHAGENTLTAWSVLADGSRSLPTVYTFDVA
jgi:hypothetical protein